MSNLSRAARAVVAVSCAVIVHQTALASSVSEAMDIRELDTMLMVSALKCRNTHPTIMTSYNGFVKSRRGELSEAANQLRAHFTASGGGAQAYDKHMTSLANRYGGWSMGPDCDTALSLIEAASGGQNLGQLSYDAKNASAKSGNNKHGVALARAERQ
jgi:hypothetical protein